jgi:hypothetical protein
MPYPAVAIGQLANVNFSGTLDGQLIISTFKYKITAIPGSPPTFDVGANAFYTKLNSGGNLVQLFTSCCPPQYTLNKVNIQLVFPYPKYQTLQYANGDVGTFTQDAHTANLAAVITRRGILASRTNIGSLHIPYANEDPGMSGGLVSGAMTTAMNTLSAFMITHITDSLNIVWEPTLAKAVPISTSDLHQITQATPQATVRVMRRRTVGVGK